MGVARGERGQQLDRLGRVDRAVALGAPFLGVGSPAPAQPVGGHHVVHVQTHAHEPIGAVTTECRDEERERAHQVGRQVDHQLALEQCLAHKAEVEVLEVAQPAVHELGRAAGGARGVVGLLHEGDRVPARRRVERHARAGDPAADHHDVELVALQCGEGVGAWDHERYVTKSVDGRRSGGSFSPMRAPEMDEPHEQLVLPHSHRGGAVGGPQDARRAPVAGQAAGVRGQQEDVDGAGGRAQVLLVLDRVARELDRRADERGRAVELRGGVGGGGLP